jgi:hypothetical protein
MFISRPALCLSLQAPHDVIRSAAATRLHSSIWRLSPHPFTGLCEEEDGLLQEASLDLGNDPQASIALHQLQLVGWAKMQSLYEERAAEMPVRVRAALEAGWLAGLCEWVCEGRMSAAAHHRPCSALLCGWYCCRKRTGLWVRGPWWRCLMRQKAALPTCGIYFTLRGEWRRVAGALPASCATHCLRPALRQVLAAVSMCSLVQRRWIERSCPALPCPTPPAGPGCSQFEGAVCAAQVCGHHTLLGSLPEYGAAAGPAAAL